MGNYIVAFDQGTTSSRSVLIDEQGRIVDMVQREFRQIFPRPGWVEHDPKEILDTQLGTFSELLKRHDLRPADIRAIGITNQRETTVVWDKHTGAPVYHALVWQDTRTSEICDALKARNLENYVRETTGLVIDSYFSATKISWILDHVPDGRARARAGDLLFGTIDTWLLWNMTEGRVHATDYSNASRTMLFDLHRGRWDDRMLGELDIPAAMLPDVMPSAGLFGYFRWQGHRIPVTGIAGDQQAALFGQACFEAGQAKNTYGTGCFLLMNTGQEATLSRNNLLTTVAWHLDGVTTYALEGSVFVAGAAVQWLRDSMGLIGDARETEELARAAGPDNPVIMVPAFAGLGAPYWNMYARGAVFGLTRDTGKAHLVQAVLNAIAFQTRDLVEAMQQDAGFRLKSLRVDGGAVANDYLMQFQSDVLDIPVERPGIIESTALGAGYLAGVGAGFWDRADILRQKTIEHRFTPRMAANIREAKYAKWREAVRRSMDWEVSPSSSGAG